MRTAWGARCILLGLRDRDTTRERIDAAHTTLRAARYRDQRHMDALKAQIAEGATIKRRSQTRMTEDENESDRLGL